MALFSQRERIVKGTRLKHPSAVVSDELDDYLLYLRSPFRIMWVNFLAGIFRGLGAVIGATAVVTGLIWLMTLIVSFPLIGEYAKDFHLQIVGFIEETRYSDDFVRIEELLVELVENSRDAAPDPETDNQQGQ